MSTKRIKGTKTSTGGNYRFDREFTRHGIGRIQLSSGTSTLAEFKRRDALLTKLLRNGQIEILRAFARGELSIEQLVDADARNVDTRLTLSSLKLRQPLWDAATNAIHNMSCAAATRKRYEVSLKALRRKGSRWLSTRATIQDLERVHWKELQSTWDGSPADYNHMRRMVSAVLTALLGDVHDPFRRSVMNRRSFPKGAEGPGRTPDLTPEAFWSVVDAMPPHAQAAPVVLLLTGMRVGEYLRTGPENKLSTTLQVVIPGTKTAGSRDVVSVDERCWPWIDQGIPSPLRYKWLRLHWVRACKAAGVKDIRLHDLRHAHGQWAVNEGVGEAKVQVSLRHASPMMTRRYVRQRDRGEVARALGDVLSKGAI